MKPKEYIIYVSHAETGSSSSFGARTLDEVIKWAFDWAGVDFRIEGVFEND